MPRCWRACDPLTAPPNLTHTADAVSTTSGVVDRVIDGDTVDVRLSTGGDPVRVRILGIDTPETVDPDAPVQCWGPEASAWAHQQLDADDTRTAYVSPRRRFEEVAAMSPHQPLRRKIDVMGKVGIFTEKPSAARNFAAALGGMRGTFEGTEYVIVHARGHLLELKDPSAMVPAPLADTYRSWELEHLPWNADDFRWEREIRRRVSGGKLVTDSDAKSLLSRSAANSTSSRHLS